MKYWKRLSQNYTFNKNKNGLHKKNIMRNNPKLSIIIPIYNAEQFIRRCIDSILE